MIGLVHLLGSDYRAMCGSEFGLVTTLASRCTCPTCLAVWDRLRERLSSPLITDDTDGDLGH